jgi:secondary thiamine-phosphate synthase enzyme
MTWQQAIIELPPRRRGFHLITSAVLDATPELHNLRVGLLHVFIQHTSASLTINENADPDVRTDLEMAFNRIAPESLPYTHTLEGRDDMPAHVKASLL